MAKKHITFNVDEEIKKQFGIECLHNEINMSDTIQNMMENFVIASKKMRESVTVASKAVEEFTEVTRIEFSDE